MIARLSGTLCTLHIVTARTIIPAVIGWAYDGKPRAWVRIDDEISPALLLLHRDGIYVTVLAPTGVIRLNLNELRPGSDIKVELHEIP